ncbi:hypothetical protein RN001_014307 [Aquatica leii]|uniref:SLC26A/SulP transporter domain-containing protein n=1 Tax=Aquatica leii TaxID=1421715 RepID=A0AAN7P280_9COLE|nr:hypothetical protein RN001_014307 [Aquatica leii]
MKKYKLTDQNIHNPKVSLTWYGMEGSDEPAKNDQVQVPTVYQCSQNLNASTAISLPEDFKPAEKSKSSLVTWIKQKTKNSCSKKMLHKRIPILSWLPQYNTNQAISDLVAGVTVGLTVIPQAIAYSNIAGLPPQIGLYSSFVACFIYTILGSCKDSAIGPTAISALLSQENSHGFGVDGAVLLCFLTGCVELLMGALQLGFIIDFISGPVSVGFTSAAAIIIATTQVKDILGLSYPGGSFLLVWEQIFQHIKETRVGDCVLGISCLVVLFTLRKLKDCQIGPSDEKKTRVHVVANKTIWFISTARNIIVVIFCSVMACLLQKSNLKFFTLTGYVKPGLPTPTVPAFNTQIGNKTYDFIEMVSTLGTAVFIVPLFGILENIALAKVFSDGRTIDATQEMLALGVCNIASSFVSSMPVTGALSRGAVNNSSGVKTTFGGIYTGIIVIVSLHFFTPYFFYIPKASLAAVIIAAVVFMVEFHVVKPIWRSKKTDLISAVATFVSCLLLRLELGIVIGIGINIISLLYASARPSVHVKKVKNELGCEYLLITPDRSLVFPSVEYVRTAVSKASVKQGSSSIPVVIDARHVQSADFTAAKGVKTLIEDFVKRKQPILFFNLKPSVTSIFQGVQPSGFVYCQTLNELNDKLNQFINA